MAITVLGAGATSVRAAPAATNATPADSAGGLEEIVVTAEKRQESLQNVPFAVTAISAAELEQRGIHSLVDFITKPTVGMEVFPMSGTPSMIMADMRGVSTSDGFTPTKELGVPIYLDDVYLPRSFSLGLDIADPQSIEILRGPQGQLFGRNAEGGAIRITSQKPTGQFDILAEATDGTRGTRRQKISINLPAVADISVKFSYLHSTQDGWVKDPPSPNISVGNNYGVDRGEAWRAALHWQPSNALAVDYSFDHTTGFSTSEYSQLTDVQPNTPHGAQPILCVCQVGTNWAPLFNPGFNTLSYGHTLTASYDINSSLQVKSISAYRVLTSVGGISDSGSLSFLDLTSAFAPGSGLPPGTISIPFAALPMFPGYSRILSPTTPVYAVQSVDAYDDVSQHQFSQEIQLLGSTDQLKYVVGLYYFNEGIRDYRDTGFAGIYTNSAETDFVGTNPFEFGGAFRQTAQTQSYAVYTQETWSPLFIDGQRLHLTAGLRYTSDQKSFNRTLQAGLPVDTTPPDFTAKRVDPAFVAAWDWTTDINSYLRFAQAYRSGGYDLGSPTLDPYQAEVNKSLELGLKSMLDDRKVRLNIDGFYSRIYDFQEAVQIDPNNPNIVITINAPGVTTIFGVENEVAYEPTPGLTLSGDYSYQNGRLPLAGFHAIDPAGVYYIENLPRHKIDTAAEYESHFLPIGAEVFHLDYSWSTFYSASARNTIYATSVPIQHNVANGRVTLQDLDFGPAHMKIALFVNNLFNKAYGTYAPIFGSVTVAEPRVVGVTLTADFR